MARPVDYREREDPRSHEVQLNGFSPYQDDPELRHEVDGDLPYQREVLHLADLVRMKTEQGLQVHIIIPTLNEGTQGNGISNIGTTLDNLLLLAKVGLVDDIEVYDSGSTDNTESEALKRGVSFYPTSEILEEYGARFHADGSEVRGKGSNLWAAVLHHPNDNDLLISVDADFGARASQIHGLISPLIENPDTQVSLPLFIRRTLQGDANGSSVQGGRVTRLVFHPHVTKHFPELHGLLDPFGGASGFHANLVRDLDLPHAFGADPMIVMAGALEVRKGNKNAISQVFTGVKSQTGRTVDSLAVMSAAMGHVTDKMTSRTGQVIFQRPQQDYLTVPDFSITPTDGLTRIQAATRNVPILYLPPPTLVLNGNRKKG